MGSGFLGRILGLFFLLSAMASFSVSVWAYTPTMTPGGARVRWKGTPKLQVVGNPRNQAGISDSSFFRAVVNSLQRWTAASGGSVGFDYWQGTDTRIYEPNSAYNGQSSVYFASNSADRNGLSPNVLGLTQVWYNTDTGEVLETDIVLNDVHYQFTTDPRDTSGYGSHSALSRSNNGRTVFIENVLTHELGHSLGISHSGGMQSTMLFMESPEQAFLGCDDQVAVRALYPGGDSKSRGSVTGQVVSEHDQSPVFGAHVVAVSRQRGAVLATAMTDRSGRYTIEALEPGTYFLMVEPFYAGPQALPQYYSGINAKVCRGGEVFGRSVLMSDEGLKPFSVQVSARNTTSVPLLIARCGSSTGGAVVTPTSASLTSGRASGYYDAPLVYDASRDGSGFGVVDELPESNELYYRIKSVSGRLQVHAVAYSLYSPIDPMITIHDLAGNEVQSSRADNVYPGTSGFVNYDAMAVAEGLPQGEYIVRVRARSMNASLYPAGPIAMDSVPFLLVTGTVNESPPTLAGALASNARCRMNENFPNYSSPSAEPPRRSMKGQVADETGFCGTIRAGTGSSSGGGSGGPSAGAIAGWILPWAMMLVIARVARRMELRARAMGANLYA